MCISFTRKYNRLLCPLIWEHVLCLSRLSHNIVTRSMWLEPTFPRSTHFEVELIFNKLFQRGKSLRLTFQRVERLLWFGKQSCFIYLSACCRDHVSQIPKCPWRSQPPGWMLFIQSNPTIPTKQSQPHYGRFHRPLVLEKVKTLQRLNEPCPALRNTDLLLLCTEMKQME